MKHKLIMLLLVLASVAYTGEPQRKKRDFVPIVPKNLQPILDEILSRPPPPPRKTWRT